MQGNMKGVTESKKTGLSLFFKGNILDFSYLQRNVSGFFKPLENLHL